MDINNAFEIITKKFENTVAPKGYSRENVADSADDLTALFIGEIAYSIVYTFQSKRVVLKRCSVEDGTPDNDWKILATWLFDPETDTEREAESIGDDFSETVKGPKQVAAAQKQKKRKKGEDGNIDPLFLANRMVTYFPELKDEIAYELSHYEQFRGVTFAHEKIAPEFNGMVEEANKDKLAKLSAGLAALYSSGDLDTKGIITYILLNTVESDEKFEQLIESFAENDKKVARESRKLRGKKIKPEKPKKSRSYVAGSLNNP